MAFKTKSTVDIVVANFCQLSDDVHIRPKQAAQLLGVGIATFWRLVSSGQLKTHKLTKRTTSIKAGDIRAFVSEKGRG